MINVFANKKRKWNSFLFIINFFFSYLILFIAIDFQESIDDDAYYDGDQQEPVHVNLLQTIDCTNQCPPYWTEPILQQK